ncbi:MAG: hypothetical protein HC884_19335 [Chloroflexaceae bacterium]|nr:hypothetical protein [Chloroflexaceae bacterium]
MRHRFDAMHIPASPFAELLVFWGSVQVGYNGFAHNPIDDAERIACPTLVLHGEHDPWITQAEIESVVQRLQGRPPWWWCRRPGMKRPMSMRPRSSGLRRCNPFWRWLWHLRIEGSAHRHHTTHSTAWDSVVSAPVGGKAGVGGLSGVDFLR